ncbi:MAG: tyrosine-protein phosphatase [Clostridia bacterium]|nr:tyrosine-protein phosphatase [Clostridia bacterium]
MIKYKRMQIKRLNLKKLNNTRDLGGLPAADGKKIKHGKLIRSERLSDLPDCTVEDLKKLKITTVVDLRIKTELEEHPDTILEGTEYHILPLLCTATAGITREKSMRKTMAKESRRIKTEFGSVDNYMIDMYKTILFNEQAQDALKSFINLVIKEEGCILWHCSGGKDRAGICAMLIEALLGVSDEVIMQDYVASSRFQRKKYFWSKFGLIIAPLTASFKGILFGMMTAKRIYMRATLDYLNEKYGSVINYCKQELGVTDKDIKILRQKYLE